MHADRSCLDPVTLKNYHLQVQNVHDRSLESTNEIAKCGASLSPVGCNTPDGPGCPHHSSEFLFSLVLLQPGIFVVYKLIEAAVTVGLAAALAGASVYLDVRRDL